MPSRFVAAVLFIAALTAASAAQTSRKKSPQTSPTNTSAPKTDVENAQRFVGVWTSEFNETVFLKLEFTMANGEVKGRIATGDIHTSQDGRLTDVSEPANNSSTTIYDIRVDGDTISFKRKDGDDVDSVQMTLVRNGEAELRFVFPSGDNAPKMKPLQLTRHIERAK